MSTGNYGKIERGEVALTVEKLQRICQILKVSVSDILDESTINITQDKGKEKSNKNLYAPVTQAEFQLLAKEVEILYEKVENINLKLKN